MEKHFYKKGGLLVLSAITALLMGFMALASSSQNNKPQTIRANSLSPVEENYDIPMDMRYRDESHYLDNELEQIEQDVMRPTL